MNETLARKIVSREELGRIAADARAAGQTIVHCHGCFDIVHPGHLRYLEFARRHGDILIVSVTGDRQIDKGSKRPFIPEELRAENLAALELVDWVYVNPHPTAVELLGDVRPDIYVKGREYEHSNDAGFLAERQVVEGYGGRVIFSSGDVVFSSTRLLQTIGDHEELDAQRLAAVCRRHDVHQRTLDAILSGTAGKRILVIGDVILDHYVLCDAAETPSEAPMMSLVELERREFVGGAAVIARHIAALGGTATLLTSGGEDDATIRARDTLRNESIECMFLRGRRAMPTKTRYVVDTSKVLRVEQAECAPLDTQTERSALTALNAFVERIDAVLWCDYGYGTVTRSLLSLALPTLRRHGKIMTANASGRRGNLLAFAGVDLLSPTEQELRNSLHDFEQGLSKVAWEAMNRTRAKHLFVTLGKGGVVVFDRQTQQLDHPDYTGRLVSEHLPALGDRVVDALGCGDAFLAVATLALATGANLMQAAYLGSAAAALELGLLGNVPVSARELRRWLDSRLELVPRDAESVRPRQRRPLRLRTSPAGVIRSPVAPLEESPPARTL